MHNGLKSALVAAMGVVAAMGMAAPASATPTSLTYESDDSNFSLSSSHLHSVGNAVENYIQHEFGNTDVDYLGYVYNGNFNESTDLQNAGLHLTLSGDFTGTSGNWTFNPGNSTYELVGVELVADTNNDLKGKIYTVNDPSNLQGNWFSDDFTVKKQECGWSSGHYKCTWKTYTYDLHKFLIFGIKAPSPSQNCPEPATLALLGAGLAGLRLRRRKAAIKQL